MSLPLLTPLPVRPRAMARRSRRLLLPDPWMPLLRRRQDKSIMNNMNGMPGDANVTNKGVTPYWHGKVLPTKLLIKLRTKLLPKMRTHAIGKNENGSKNEVKNKKLLPKNLMIGEPPIAITLVGRMERALEHYNLMERSYRQLLGASRRLVLQRAR